MGLKEFFKNAFADMKQSAKDQHEVDKANLAAVKAESKAQWEEAKRTPKQQQEAMRQKQAEQIAAAKQREAEANERIAAAKSKREFITKRKSPSKRAIFFVCIV